MSLEQEFREHVKHTQQRFSEVENDVRDLRNMQAENARQIATLVTSIQKLTDDTAGVRAVYQNVQGTIRTGAAVQDLMISLGKLGLLGAGVAAVIRWVLEQAPQG
jgi:methyl-accepting chemotaxis protein